MRKRKSRECLFRMYLGRIPILYGPLLN